MEVDLIGVPLDFGAGRRGVDMGASAIRYAGLQPGLQSLGHTVHDLGNLDVPLIEMCKLEDEKLRYVDCIVPMARKLMGKVATSIRAGRFPLTLGGDHSISIGSVRGAARNKNIGVLWIDAHADFNTRDTTPSGNIHGMSLAALTGHGPPILVGLGEEPKPVINPKNVVIIGVRDLDPGEKLLLKQSGATVFSMSEIDELGIHKVMETGINIATRDTTGIFLSFDLDALDPIYAPGVGTPVPGGLTYREAHLACEMVAATKKLIAMDLVEVNPILDERNKTATMAMELAFSALGKRVW